MSVDWAAELLAQYEAWFSTRIEVDPVNDEYVEITTPFLDHHNDRVQIYVRREPDGNYFLTDDAYTLTDLSANGVEIEGEPRLELFRTTLNGFGIDWSEEDDALIAHATDADLGERVNSLVQAVLAVDGLWVVAKSHVRSMFFDDVARFLTANEIRFDPKPKFRGKSGYNHTVDFALHGINGSEAPRMRLLQAVANPTKQVVTQDIFIFNDVRDAGLVDFVPIAFLNDSDGEEEPISEDTYNAFDTYQIDAVPWSDNQRIRQALALAR